MRKAALKGQWYPAQPDLGKMLDRDFSFVPDNDISFIVVPHAGLEYCQQTQASAFSRINPSLYLHVIVLAVNHRFRSNELAQTPYS